MPSIAQPLRTISDPLSRVTLTHTHTLSHRSYLCRAFSLGLQNVTAAEQQQQQQQQHIIPSFSLDLSYAAYHSELFALCIIPPYCGTSVSEPPLPYTFRPLACTALKAIPLPFSSYPLAFTCASTLFITTPIHTNNFPCGPSSEERRLSVTYTMTSKSGFAVLSEGQAIPPYPTHFGSDTFTPAGASANIP